eukprot:COSAG01_NODE_2230_length_8125_cov_9.414652_8_plen_59_part_00
MLVRRLLLGGGLGMVVPSTGVGGWGWPPTRCVPLPPRCVHASWATPPRFDWFLLTVDR